VMEAHLQSDPSLVKVFRLDQRDGTAGVGILLRPLPLVDASDGSRNPAVAIFISNPAQSRGAQRDVLMELFGFTPSEANLALQLANGLTLDEASEVLSISRNTAKSHLSAIFSKTGVTRQTKLIQLILKSVALMGE
jgi:DNA-binding CsgD family transcriptional regulator